nr:NYN domain-containing protein [Oscillospiraceae bacterium]
VYTKENETADSYIERVSRELGKEYTVRVATSDNLEQIIIMGNGAYRISASEFYAEVQNTEKAMEGYSEKFSHFGNLRKKQADN